VIPLFAKFFEDDHSYLYEPFDGETLYSWCTRTHRLNAHITARQTNRRLFGNPISGFRHDFPINLDSLCDNTNQLLGTVDEIIYDRTPFSIFAPFLSRVLIESIIQNMRIGGASRVKYHLGILPSRVGTAVPLKACPNCIKLDISTSDISWWHIEHQWPTNRVCPKHGDYLLMATPEFHSRTLRDWHLPSELQSSDWHSTNVTDEIKIKLRELSMWSAPLIKSRSRPFDGELLRLTYHLRAKVLGWTAMDGSLRFDQIRTAFRDNHKCLEELPGFTFIKDINQVHGGFLNLLLRQFKGNKHPLKHALVLNFLFDTPEQFLKEYERVLSTSAWLSNKQLWSELTEDRNQLKLLVTDSGYSVNAAAKELCIPVGQAVRVLKMDGVAYNKRPRVLDPQKESQLKTLLESGEEREVIASTLNIKKTFIKDYLARHPTLRDTWIAEHLKNNIDKFREKFRALLQEHPDLSVKKLKLLPGNGIQWLCRHDRIWIERQLPSLWQTQHVDE